MIISFIILAMNSTQELLGTMLYNVKPINDGILRKLKDKVRIRGGNNKENAHVL